MSNEAVNKAKKDINKYGETPVLENDKFDSVLSTALLVPLDDPGDASCRWGIPILFWGPPGIGKSGRVDTAAQIARLDTRTVYLSTHPPEDFSGAPFPDGKGDVKIFATLPGIRELVKSGRGLIFFDELSGAAPRTQGSAMSTIYTRYLAGERLPGRIRMIGAANPPEEAAGGFNLAPPMSNRWMHFFTNIPTRREWTSWLYQSNTHDMMPIEASEHMVAERWPQAWSRATALIGGYIEATGEASLYKLPPVGSKDRGRAWASPRTWEFATRCVATCLALHGGQAMRTTDPANGQLSKWLEIAQLLVGGCVGKGLAVEWLEWAQKADLPTAEEVLAGRWKPDPSRLDIAHAIYGSVVSYALTKPDTDQGKHDTIVKAWNVLTTAMSVGGVIDTALPGARALSRAGWTSKKGPQMEQACKALVFRLGSLGMVEQK